jgi:nickel-dependent lactate racemase
METVDLKYGRSIIPMEFDPQHYKALGAETNDPALTDVEIGSLLDEPIDTLPIEEIVRSGDRVLLVVPDATRQSGSGQIVNLLVRRLIANGSTPADINIIFATGIHRPVTDDEKIELLTPFIAQRIKTLDHVATDAIRNFRVGETAGGIPVELDWTLTEYDHVVTIGSVTFHYFAGFTGGRKLICPGLASRTTIDATHKLAFDCSSQNRAAGVGAGLLDGNPVHEAFIEAASKVRVSFAVNTIVNDRGEVTGIYCGDQFTSHRRACEAFTKRNTVQIPQKRDVVVVSCGGYPLDINMIQAHKALDAAANACARGGMIILLAECADGLGRSDFLDWFEADDSRSLAEKLCANYQVNGQTAWSLLTKAERFKVKMVTSLDDSTVQKMRIEKLEPKAISNLMDKKSGYIIPAGSKICIKG